MEGQQIILLVINILGGLAVIGSYVFGLKRQSGGANVLWGGVPANIRPLYGVSMILSALGYFAFIYFILFRLVPEETVIGEGNGFGIFYTIFLVMLIASALWMPLTNLYVSRRTAAVWTAIRIVLGLVGLASAALPWALFNLQTQGHGVAFWLAVSGSVYFAFHTVVLDAIVWAALFRKTS